MRTTAISVQPPLGAPLTDEEVAALGKALAEDRFLTAVSLSNLLKQYDEDTQKKISAAIIANGGDSQIVSTALRLAEPTGPGNKKLMIFWGIASTASAAVATYHGYKRNQSVGWALWWGLCGALFPIVTPTIALAQGFGKEK